MSIYGFWSGDTLTYGLYRNEAFHSYTLMTFFRQRNSRIVLINELLVGRNKIFKKIDYGFQS